MTDVKDAEAQNGSLATSQSEERQEAPPATEKGRPNEDSRVGAAEDPPAEATKPPNLPPLDGGRDAWLSVLGGWFGFFVSFGWMNSIGIFQEYYQKNFLSNYSPSEVAWIPSTEVFFLFFCGPIFGKVFDNYGPRGLLIGGGFLHVFGLMMASLGTQYYQLFLAQSVVSSIGASAIFYGTMNAVSTWFLKKRATAIGIIASGSSVGGVILPIMLTRLIPRIGFGWSMRTVAFMFLGMMVITITTTKSRLTHTKKPIQLMEFIHPLKEPPFILLTMGSFLFFFGTFLPFNFLILQAQEEGMSTGLSNYLLSILNAARCVYLPFLEAIH
jgi:MFS family permease